MKGIGIIEKNIKWIEREEKEFKMKIIVGIMVKVKLKKKIFMGGL